MAKTTLITIGALGASIASLATKAAGSDFAADLVKLQADLQAFGEQPVPVDQSALVASLQEQLDESAEMITDLKKQLEDALNFKATKVGKLVVTIDKVKYQVNHGAHPYTAKQLAEDPEKARPFLKIAGQNVLTKL